ncbi:phospholipid scramblase-related protein [Nitrospirota bacterium]
MSTLKECRILRVLQQTSAAEAIKESFDIEQENTYQVVDDKGQEMYFATEHEEHGFFFKSFLNSARPFTITVQPKSSKHGIRVKRPFRFYFHEASVELLDGRPLGTIKKRFTILNRKYSILDPKGQEKFLLSGPLWKPWTFNIEQKGEKIGVLTKDWSGLIKETLTEADNFSLKFPRQLNPVFKLLLLGSVFLIDFVHFEKSPNQKS